MSPTETEKKTKQWVHWDTLFQLGRFCLQREWAGGIEIAPEGQIGPLLCVPNSTDNRKPKKIFPTMWPKNESEENSWDRRKSH